MIESAREHPAAEVGDEHRLGGVEELGGLGHEVDAGQDDDVGIGLDGQLRQRQRVAREVGDAVEDLRRLVVVGQDDGVVLLLQLVDRSDVRGVEVPLDLGDDAASSARSGPGWRPAPRWAAR